MKTPKKTKFDTEDAEDTDKNDKALDTDFRGYTKMLFLFWLAAKKQKALSNLCYRTK